MYKIKYSKQFRKDLKSFKNDSLLFSEIKEVLEKLRQNIPLSINNKNHPLQGKFKGCFECHVRPDILLIYTKKEEELIILLLRINSHSNLF